MTLIPCHTHNVVEWVSDELHDLLGLSDRYTAEYLTGLAKKASSLTSFLKQLQDTGAITINDDVNSFATLWDKVPHRTAVEKPAKVKEREAILQRQRNKRYQLLMDSDEEEDTIKRSSHTQGVWNL